MPHNMMKELKFGARRKYIRENGLGKRDRRVIDTSLRVQGKNRKLRAAVICTMDMAAAGMRYAMEKEMEDMERLMNYLGSTDEGVQYKPELN